MPQTLDGTRSNATSHIMQTASLTVVVGLSNLGDEGRPHDDDIAFDPLMSREAAEAVVASFRDAGLAPPSQTLERHRNVTSPRSALARANVLLASRNLPTHDEPADAPAWEPAAPNPVPVEALFRLRRVMAHHLLRAPLTLDPLPRDADPREDPMVVEAQGRADSHLMQHAELEGFYLPIQIASVVRDESGMALAGGWLGSSYRLAEELRAIAPHLGVRLKDGTLDTALRDEFAHNLAPTDAFHLEKWAWLLHLEAAEASIRHGLAIVYH